MRALLATALLLAGCAGAAPPEPTPVPAAGWRAVATADDRARLRDWRSAWMRALDQANSGQHRATVAAEGVLLRPDAALPGAALPPGDYRCRVIKLGSRAGGDPTYIAYPAFTCRVAGDSFVKRTGSQRPVGTLYPDSDARQVFLGTLELGDETMPVAYGRDRERDLAAVVERIGPRRWRMAFPLPHYESLLDVIELVPAGGVTPARSRG